MLTVAAIIAVRSFTKNRLYRLLRECFFFAMDTPPRQNCVSVLVCPLSPGGDEDQVLPRFPQHILVPLRLVERGDKAAEVSACGWQAAGAYFFNDRFISV
jgi:hypothetical protein